MAEIDYIVPMVFPEDALWQQDFRKCNSRYVEDHVRWRSWGTERLLIQLVKKNMPWIRTIHVLLARKSQLQYWMNEEGVHVVYHKDFIPQRLLPLFNSCAIEMYLHQIPGISEKFIYGNDDMFPLMPMREEDFFENGKPCQTMNEKLYPEKPNIFHKICLNGLNFVGREFGMRYTNTWLKNGHSMAPILKSTCEHLWQVGGKEIECSVTSFRSERNFIQYIYPWWQHLSGNYVSKAPKTTYIGTNTTLPEKAKAVIEKKDSIVCINDNGNTKNYQIYAEIVRKALKEALDT